MSSMSGIKHVDTLHEMDHIRTNASVTIPSDVFEKMYLSPEIAVKGQLRKTMANPTPTGLMGFLIATTPVSCNLMGWHGSGGGGAALVGTIYIFGGAFTFTLAITFTPSANAQGAFTANTSNASELAAGMAEFKSSFAFFYICCAVLVVMFTICSLRTNIVFFFMFLLLGPAFICIACAYWASADGNDERSQRFEKVGLLARPKS
ncbi:hypothetical protein N7499_009592 [Penicillium canescens]|nr:hypothetical protein N7522_001318 [Penicillium canescens]KAJ6071578.1 hypothetical protein N7499_009592 [Penicillium canescens]KAJ6170258.1 hypothetical protein N7485_007604 [Penicillium canescens]